MVIEKILQELAHLGLLLQSDRVLPSVTTLVTGAPIRGSWWGHPKGHAIFRVSEQLAEHPDVLLTKLVSGKWTYVHRRLWRPFVGAATSREPWQMRGLSPAARSLLFKITAEGSLRTDQVKSPPEAAKELEKRLLVHSEEFHTEKGSHAKQLESWEHWATRVGFAEEKMPADQAKRHMEEILEAINTGFGGKGRLPWQGGI